MGGGLRKAGLLMRHATQGVAAGPRCPAVEEQAEGLVPSLRAAALLVGPPWVVANGVWSERWRGNWERVLPVVGEHAGKVPMVQVLAEEVPIMLALVLLVCR